MTEMSRPIGVFDSGIGGLTVLHELRRQLPHESMVYFGDTARVPYGEKSPETVLRFSIENAEFLLEKNIKILVIACNTATAHALEKLKNQLQIPVLGVIEPGARKAAQITRNQRIAVLATKGTIQSGAYQRAIQCLLPTATIIPVACPLLVPLVEEHFIHHPATKLIVKEYLEPLKSQNIDTVLLGCTHYPLLRTLIQDEVGEVVSLVDSAITCAEEVDKLLGHHHLHAKDTKPFYRYFVSDDPEKFQKVGRTFLGEQLTSVEVKGT